MSDSSVATQRLLQQRPNAIFLPNRLMLDVLGVSPLLDLELRLGEGSGAALTWPLIDSAVRLLAEMASFESAGVSTRMA